MSHSKPARRRMLPLSILLIPAMLLFGAQNAPAQAFKRGDSNADGRVDLFDTFFTNNYLFMGQAIPGCLDSTDANDDGNVNVSDPVFTLNWYANGGPPTPLPGPTNCGGDPTIDNLSCITSPPCSPIPLANAAGVTYQFLQSPVPPVTPTDTWGCSEVVAQIANTSLTYGVGAWSMSIQRSGDCRILEVTTAGTVVPIYMQNNPGGFQKSEVTQCGNSAISMVILSSIQPVSLGTGIHNVLRLKMAVKKIVGAIPQLSFVNGQQCSGNPPVRNLVSDYGVPKVPTLVGITLTPPLGTAVFNTLPGTNVDVCLRPNVWVTFGSISTPMVTTAAQVTPTNANFNIPGMAFAWSLGPSGSYPPSVKVNFRYPCGWSLAQKLGAQLWHRPGGVGPWNLVSTTNNTCTSVLTGMVPSFSDFGITLPPELSMFRRGDANADQRIDISDGIQLLGCQFLGGACPICADAGDANDDGHLDIGDAVFVFNYQFLGGREPPSPGPSVPGIDPTEDGLGPCSYPVELDEDDRDEEGGEEEGYTVE